MFLEKSHDTSVTQWIGGYRDKTGLEYRYDSLVPNYRNLGSGDFVNVRKENRIVGTSIIGKIFSQQDPWVIDDSLLKAAQ